MKKVILGVAAIVVLAVIGVFAFSGSDSAGNQMNQDDQAQKPQETMANNSSEAQALPEYVREANVRETKDASGQSEVTVEAGDIFYNPTVLTVSKGTKVTWKNTGSIDHTVTSAENSPRGGLDSGTLAPGETYSFTFNDAGDYNYFCEFHQASMKGVVIVTE